MCVSTSNQIQLSGLRQELHHLQIVRFDGSFVINLLNLLSIKVGQTDGFCQSLVEDLFHGLPCVIQVDEVGNRFTIFLFQFPSIGDSLK